MAEKKNFLSARHSIDYLLSDHTEKLCRRQYGNAERLRLDELTAGIFAADQVVGILGYPFLLRYSPKRHPALSAEAECPSFPGGRGCYTAHPP